MEKKLSDYLHLYLPIDVELNNGGSKVYNRIAVAVGNTDDEYRYVTLRLGKGAKSFTHSVLLSEGRVKPILRPLSDMTEDYFLSLFKIADGIFEDAKVSEYKRVATDDLYIRMGYGQFLFGFRRHPKPDVRVTEGISFYTKRYHIEETISVGEDGIEKGLSHWNNEKLELVYNQSEIFNKLRRDGYDCDGLIEAGIAIDKSKQNIK